MDYQALWQRFMTWEIPVHSLLVSQGGELQWETYREPYGRDRLHRMFSITKSYSALAVGCLAAEGKLLLDDPIIRFFPEYLPEPEKIHPYVGEMTIRDMLTMQTCHSATTYKQHPEQNWVESFFITQPTHKSGQIFLYDTSASHTLAALVKKLTGMGVLDYLRTCFLDEIGFSREAYIIPDPFGAEMGGSGMMAYPMDLMKTARYLMERIKNGTDPFSDYLRTAVEKQVPTRHFGQSIDEQQGYGYQFWRIRNGFAMYGMGGQYVLFYPEWDIMIVTTADSQNIKGGAQKILDAIYDMVTPCEAAAAAPASGQEPISKAIPVLNNTYQLRPNNSDFTELKLITEANGGILKLSRPDYTYEIPFGWGKELQNGILARYNVPIASAGIWLMEDFLFIETQLVGEYVGSLSFAIRFQPDGVIVWMKKVEETCFHEFSGFIEGM